MSLGLLHCPEHGIKIFFKKTKNDFLRRVRNLKGEEIGKMGGKKCSMNLICMALCCLTQLLTLNHWIGAGKYHVYSQ